MKKESVRFKAVITYDGSCFSGWQNQPEKKTVQNEIEKVLSQILQQKIMVLSSGRTDASVHATKLFISFCAKTSLEPKQIQKAMNALLEKSIRVKDIAYADIDFHPRFDAKKKIYRYLITEFDSPFLINRAWCVWEKLNISRMRKAATCIVGTHDFRCFHASGRKVKDTVRTIEYIKIKREYFCFDPDIKIIAIDICGTGFLYKMARNIVGTLVDVGRGKIMPQQVKQIIDSKDRRKASATAPGYGLYLRDVIYE